MTWARIYVCVCRSQQQEQQLGRARPYKIFFYVCNELRFSLASIKFSLLTLYGFCFLRDHFEECPVIEQIMKVLVVVVVVEINRLRRVDRFDRVQGQPLII